MTNEPEMSSSTPIHGLIRRSMPLRKMFDAIACLSGDAKIDTTQPRAVFGYLLFISVVYPEGNKTQASPDGSFPYATQATNR